MKQKSFILCLLLGLVFSVNSLQAQDQAGFDVEKVLPGDTLLYVGLTDGASFCDAMRETDLAGLFESEEWKYFFSSFPTEMFDQLKQGQQQMASQFGIDFDNVHMAFAGNLSLAVVDVQMAPMPYPTVLLSWDLGNQKETVSQLIEMVKQQIGMEMPPHLKMEDYEVNGYSVTVIPTPMNPVVVSYVGNVLLICSDQAYLESILVGEYPEESLANSTQYQDVKKQLLKGNSGVLFYLNTAGAMSTAEENFPNEWMEAQGFVQMLGVDSLHALGFSFSFDKGQVNEAFYMYTPEGRSGVFGDLVPEAPVSKELVKFLPEELISFEHGYIDFAGWYRVLSNLAENMAPYQYQEFLQMKQEMEGELGLSLEDFLNSLGNEYMISFSFSGGLIPDLALQVSLKDEAMFQSIFQQVLAIVPPQVRYQFTWQGHNFTYFNYSRPRRDPVPVAPTVLIEDNRFLLTLFPETAKSLATVTNGKLPEDALRYLNDGSYTMARYANLKDLLVPIYRTALPLIQALVPRSEIPVEPALLPSADLVEKHLNNAIFYGVINKEGICWDSYSPFGLTPFSVVLGGIGYFAEQNPYFFDDLFDW